MEFTKMFYHPKKYKELHGLTSRKCNTRQRAQGSLPANGALNSDQAISLRAHDGECERAPDPGHMLPDSKMVKQRASSSTSRGQEHQAPSSKRQASSTESVKPQATSVKPQA